MSSTNMNNVPFPLLYQAMVTLAERCSSNTTSAFSSCHSNLCPSSSPRENVCPQLTLLGHKGVLPGWSMVGVNPNPQIPSFHFWCFTFFFLDRLCSVWPHFCPGHSVILIYGGQCNLVFNLNSSSGLGGDTLWKLIINSACHWAVWHASS